MIPNEPNMLLSFINMKLRDFYSSLDALCDDLDGSKDEIIKKLDGIGYSYNEEENSFQSK